MTLVSRVIAKSGFGQWGAQSTISLKSGGKPELFCVLCRSSTAGCAVQANQYSPMTTVTITRSTVPKSCSKKKSHLQPLKTKPALTSVFQYFDSKPYNTMSDLLGPTCDMCKILHIDLAWSAHSGATSLYNR